MRGGIKGIGEQPLDRVAAEVPGRQRDAVHDDERDVARVGPGVDMVNIWAFPNPGSGQGPVFLGSAGTSAGGAFELAVEGLGPGPYDLAVYPHSTVTGQFGAASAVRVRVK